MKTLITLALSLIPLSGLFAIDVAQTTIRVPGDMLTIQAAVDAAPVNTVILVSRGTYHENITIEEKHRLTIRPKGKHKVIIDGGGQGPAVAVWASGEISLLNLRMQNAEGGVYAAEVQGLKVKRCRMVDVQFGVGVDTALNVDISKCRISATEYGVFAYVGASTIRDCRFSDSGYGIFLLGALSTVEDNRMKNVWVGVMAGSPGGGQDDDYCLTSLIRGNHIKGAEEVGIYCSDSSAMLTILENKVRGGSYGIFLENGDLEDLGDLGGHVVARNRIRGTDEFGLMSDSFGSQLLENRIKDVEGVGILIEDQAELNHVVGNVVKNASEYGFLVSGEENFLAENRAKKSGLFDLLDESDPGENFYQDNKFSRIAP